MNFKPLVLLTTLFLTGCSILPSPTSEESKTTSQGDSIQQSVESNESVTSKDNSSEDDKDPSITLDYASKKGSFNSFTVQPSNHSSYTLTNDSLTISNADTYELSGYFKGIIEVKVAKCTLVLNNAYLEGTDGYAPIYYNSEDKKGNVTVSLADNSDNYVITEGIASSSDPKNKTGAIYSVNNLVLDGSGKVTIAGGLKHGVKADKITIRGGGTYYIQGTSDGSSVNCNQFVVEDGANPNLYLINSKNAVKADESIDIEGGIINVFDCSNGFKTDTGLVDDDGITPINFITIGSNAKLNFHSVKTQFSTDEGKLNNNGQVKVIE